jgi:hypothetical protein
MKFVHEVHSYVYAIKLTTDSQIKLTSRWVRAYVKNDVLHFVGRQLQTVRQIKKTVSDHNKFSEKGRTTERIIANYPLYVQINNV